MDRMEEYRALQAGLTHAPAALEGSVQRALARRRRERRVRRAWGSAFGGAAAVFALFVLLVNVSAPFAAACEGIPLLKELASAVSFSHSLSSAVDHGYVQDIGQSRTDNGITVELDYMMLDGGQAVFFGRVTGPEDAERFLLRSKLSTREGGELEGYAMMSGSVAPGALCNLFTVAINPEEFRFPEVLRITCEVEMARSDPQAPPADRDEGPDGEGERPADACVVFETPVEGALLNRRRAIPADQWFELEGGRLHLSGLELYPTFARFTLEQDGDNPAVLQRLDYYLTDERGNRYESGSASGLSAMGDSYWFESPFFQEPQHLTLHVTGTTWREEGRERVTVDLNTGAALSPLPDGVRSAVRRTADGVEVALIAPLGQGSTEDRHELYQLFGGSYASPDGTQYEINQCSSHTGSPWYGGETEEAEYEGCFSSIITLRDWTWDTVELELYYTSREDYADPIRIPLF